MPNPEARSSRTLAPVAALMLLTVACSGSADEGPDAHTFQVIQEQGTPVALTQGGPSFEGELFEYEIDLYLKEDEREESLLYQPMKFVADEEGTFYLSDTGTGDIAVFDSEGRFVRRFGSKGQGPGEFLYPMIQRVQGGIVHVYDMQQRRSTRYTTTGEFLDVSRFQMPLPMIREPGEPYWSTGDIQMVSEDRYLLSTSMTRYDNSGYYRAIGALLVGSAGDTLWSIRTPEVKVGETRMRRQGDMEFQSPVIYPFGPTLSSLYVPAHGIVMVTGWEGELEVYDLEGRLSRKIRVEGLRHPVTDTDREAITGWYRERIDAATEDRLRVSLEESLRAMIYPDRKAVFGRIKYDDRGYLYVGTQDEYGAMATGARGILYYVISPQGEYLGKTRRPGGYSSEVAGGRLLVIAANAEDTEGLVAVYAMNPIPEGFRFP